MRRRMCAILLAMLLLIPAAAAQTDGGLTVEDYIAAMPEETAWAEDGTEWIRTAELAEGVTVSLCADAENAVAAITVEYPQGELNAQVLEAVRAAVQADVEALTTLEGGEECSSGGWVLGRICGENREAVYACPETLREQMLWQPVHGGDQIHDRPRCSGMDVARMITPEAAQALALPPCGTCRAEAQSGA